MPSSCTAYLTEPVCQVWKGRALWQVRLVSPATGKVVARYGLEAGEVALAAAVVHLSDSSASGRTRPLVAVGTSFSAGTPWSLVIAWKGVAEISSVGCS